MIAAFRRTASSDSDDGHRATVDYPAMTSAMVAMSRDRRAAPRSPSRASPRRKAAQPSASTTRFEVAHMGIAHGRGHAAIGDDAADDQRVDAALAQHPFEPRHVEGRIGDLLDRRGRRAPEHRPVAWPQRPARNRPSRETAAAPSGAARSSARRLARHQRELGRDDPARPWRGRRRRAAAAAPAVRRCRARSARRAP